MGFYPGTIEQKIGFDSVRDQLAAACLSALGTARCEEMAFSTDFNTVRTELEQTAEMLGIINSDAGFPTGNIHDRRQMLAALRVPGSFPAESELPGLRASLTAMADIA
ncbi:MAG: endonuclease MutS2, partial [Muribaculaceae bacterium]|nr:endonuclease MutS2 [Muribaculaceae bacterium]